MYGATVVLALLASLPACAQAQAANQAPLTARVNPDAVIGTLLGKGDAAGMLDSIAADTAPIGTDAAAEAVSDSIRSLFGLPQERLPLLVPVPAVSVPLVAAQAPATHTPMKAAHSITSLLERVTPQDKMQMAIKDMMKTAMASVPKPAIAAKFDTIVAKPAAVVAKPVAAKAVVAKPAAVVAKPVAAKVVVAKPAAVVAKPVAAKVVVAKPAAVAAKQVAAPVEAKPMQTVANLVAAFAAANPKPVVAKPVVAKAVVAKPVAVVAKLAAAPAVAKPLQVVAAKPVVALPAAIVAKAVAAPIVAKKAVAVAKPAAAKAAVAKPTAAKAAVAKAAVAKPAAAKAAAAKAAVAKPAAAKAVVAKAVAAPVVAKPAVAVAKPAAAKAAVAKPAVAKAAAAPAAAAVAAAAAAPAAAAAAAAAAVAKPIAPKAKPTHPPMLVGTPYGTVSIPHRSLRAAAVHHDLPVFGFVEKKAAVVRNNHQQTVLTMTMVPSVASAPEPLMSNEIAPKAGLLSSLLSGISNLFFGAAPKPAPEPVLNLNQVKTSKQDFAGTAEATFEDSLYNVDIHDAWADQEKDDDAQVEWVKREDRALRVDAQTSKAKPSVPVNSRNDKGSIHIAGFWRQLEKEDSGISAALKEVGDDGDLREYGRLVDLQDAKVAAEVTNLMGPAGKKLEVERRNRKRLLKESLLQSSVRRQ